MRIYYATIQSMHIKRSKNQPEFIRIEKFKVGRRDKIYFQFQKKFLAYNKFWLEFSRLDTYSYSLRSRKRNFPA